MEDIMGVMKSCYRIRLVNDHSGELDSETVVIEHLNVEASHKAVKDALFKKLGGWLLSGGDKICIDLGETEV
jgi:hypothetical protein